MKALSLICFVVSLAVGIAAPAKEFSPEVEREAGKIFHSVMSPFCPGRLIADCPSPRAADLRREILGRIDAGESPDAIRADLYATYGDSVRAAPSAEGFNLLAWAIPFVAVTLGGVFVLVWLRRRTAPVTTSSEAVRELDAELRVRFEAELDAELSRMS